MIGVDRRREIADFFFSHMDAGRRGEGG
jgi:hypothetical protein